VNRREFLGTVAAGGAAVLSPLARAAGAAPPDTSAPFATATARRILPFAPGHVTLGAGPASDALARNQRYLESLPVDRLLHMYRVTAGISSSAAPVGGWEKPDCELRGHFTGHYLSACALMKAYAGDDELASRGAGAVQALAACQQRIGNGYLGAYPEELYDRLKAGRRVWAPFYTYHKILAGHLDLHQLTGNTDALQTAERMAQWVAHWLNGVSEAHLQRILQTEYGGMNEVLYNLAEATGKEQYLELGHRFTQPSFFDPLAEQRDELKGLHVNTQIPKIIGAARRYELTGDWRYRRIAEYFWREVVHARSYCVGNTSNHEGWRTAPGVLSTELSDTTAECCCAYNMLKLTRLLFMWTGDPEYADYYERALFNCRLGTQHPHEGRPMYYFPLASGYWKLYGSALDSFWCCTGTGVEEFSRLADSIYFHDADSLYVNLFIASEVKWDAKGVRVRQDTRFPADGTVGLRIDADRPVSFTMHVRVPYWTAPGGRVAVNGTPLPSFASAGSYLTLTRTWQPGDRVEVTLPMALHRAPMPDDRRLQAVMYGPVVLAGRLGSEGLTEELQTGGFDQDLRSPAVSVAPIDGDVEGDVRWVEPVKGEALSFRTVGQRQNLPLVPVNAIHGERYAVYWRFAAGA
jgi:DUF1680 family protein